MTRGRFITFEGGEGAGKTTQCERLLAWLAARNIDAIRTREPGGSTGGEAIRDLVVHGGAGRWSAISEALLMFAARSDHLERVIRPALDDGRWVVCDRFHDSTMAYQGYGHGLGRGPIERLTELVVAADLPDLTLVIDLPVEVGLARAAQRREGGTRFEGLPAAFHERLRAGFLDIAKREPERCVVIDGSAEPDAVADAVARAVTVRLLSDAEA